MKFFHNYKDYLNNVVFIKNSDTDKLKYINNQEKTINKKYVILYNILKDGFELDYIEQVLNLSKQKISSDDIAKYFDYIENVSPKNYTKAKTLFIRTQKLYALWSDMYGTEDIIDLFSVSKDFILVSLFNYVKNTIDVNGEIVDDELLEIINIIKNSKVCLDYTILTYYAKNNGLENDLEELRRAVKDWCYMNDFENDKSKELYIKFNMLFNLENIKESREAVKDKTDRERRSKIRNQEQQQILNDFIERKKVQTCKICNATKPISGNFNTYIKANGIAGMENICRDCK